jgi:recombination protein RecA
MQYKLYKVHFHFRWCIVHIGEKQMSNSEHNQVTSSGSASLDAALNGGYPNGSVIEIFGQTASGKTTVALRAIAEAQKVTTNNGNGNCCFIDLSYSYNVNYAKILGIDTEKLLIIHSMYAKDMINTAITILHTGSINLMVIEDFNMLFAFGFEYSLFDIKSHFEKVVDAAKKTNTTLIFTNQLIRQFEKIENPITFMKYLTSIQLKTTKMNDNKIGVQILKNKFGSKTSELEF